MDLARCLKRFLAGIAAFAAVSSFGREALAHPHVYITGQSEIVYGAGKTVVAVKHRWTFDELFSAMASQGLDENGDGAFSREELADLAQINVESLAEYAFFTFLDAGDVAAEFLEPIDYWLEHGDGKLTLHFTLPVKGEFAIGAGHAAFSVYDPSFFVAFVFDPGKEVALVNAPQGCAARVTRQQDLERIQGASLADAFIMDAGLDANLGEDFAGQITLTCS